MKWLTDNCLPVFIMAAALATMIIPYMLVLGDHVSGLDAQFARGTSFDESPYSTNVFSSRSTPSPGVDAIKVVMEFPAHGETE